MKTSKIIADLRKAKGWSQADLAKKNRYFTSNGWQI